MRFGTGYNEVRNEVVEGGSDYIRAFKEGETKLVLLASPDEWVGYHEHYNPAEGKFSFPCTQEDDCPGCNSDNQRMSSRSRKIAFPALVGDKWVNVYSINRKGANKLAMRAEKDLDREYTVVRIGKDKDTDYDFESGDKVTLDRSKFDVPDIEKMLMDRYEESWGDKKSDPKADTPSSTHSNGSSPTTAPTQESEYTVAELQALSPRDLKKILRSEGLYGQAPEEIQDSEDSQEIVEWIVRASKS